VAQSAWSEVVPFVFSSIGLSSPVITPGHIEELDDEGRLLEDEYPYYGVTDEEHDGIEEMCDPYEGL